MLINSFFLYRTYIKIHIVNQKGAVENGNKLVRQYIPKGTDISSVSDAKIRMVKSKINTRPREKLKFYTPTEVFFKNIS